MVEQEREGGARPAVFLDRDGVLNEELNFVHRPTDFVWIEGAGEAVRYFNDNGYLVFVVTNQSGVARGYFGEAEVEALHGWINDELARSGARIDGFYYCPHHPEARLERYRRDCGCRKPAPGMIHRACREWPVEKRGSFLIGDRERDIEAATAAGIGSFLFTGGNLLTAVRASGLLQTAEERAGKED